MILSYLCGLDLPDGDYSWNFSELIFNNLQNWMIVLEISISSSAVYGLVNGGGGLVMLVVMVM